MTPTQVPFDADSLTDARTQSCQLVRDSYAPEEARIHAEMREIGNRWRAATTKRDKARTDKELNAKKAELSDMCNRRDRDLLKAWLA